MDPALLAAWAAPPAPNPLLFLPPPNAFVATDFGLKPPPAEPRLFAANEPLPGAAPEALASEAPMPPAAVDGAGAALAVHEAADRIPATLVHSDAVLDVW